MISVYLLRQRIINFTLVGFLLATGLIMIGFSVYILISDANKELPVERFNALLLEECASHYRDLGFENVHSVSSQNEVRIIGYELDDGLYELAKLSLGMRACDGFTLKSFCAGESCGNKGVSMILERK